MRIFNFYKSSPTVSYPIWHTQLAVTQIKIRKIGKTRKTKEIKGKKNRKRLRLTKNKSKGKLKQDQINKKTNKKKGL